MSNSQHPTPHRGADTGSPQQRSRFKAWRIPAMMMAALTIQLALAPAPARAVTLPVVASTAVCGDLMAIDFTDTDGAPFRLDAATVVPAGTGVPQEYCKVTGYVASQIHFEVHLPTKGWTQRLFVAGCGGYCGAVTLSPSSAINQAFGCVPAQSGEMVLAFYDNGHVRAASGGTVNTPSVNSDGLWALNNPGALVDFAYNGVHKATLAAKELVSTFYGCNPATHTTAGVRMPAGRDSRKRNATPRTSMASSAARARSTWCRPTLITMAGISA